MAYDAALRLLRKFDSLIHRPQDLPRLDQECFARQRQGYVALAAIDEMNLMLRFQPPQLLA
jgi:hypothetical protein